MSDRGFSMKGNKNTNSGLQAGRVGDNTNVGTGYDRQTTNQPGGARRGDRGAFDMADNENSGGLQVGDVGDGSNVGKRS